MFEGKILAIMQPYFFPYLGYFSLMHYAHALILFDVVEYDRKGWMHRNRILKPKGNDWQYIRAGVEKPPYKAIIKDVRLTQGEDWKERIFRQLEHYRSKAPFYGNTIKLIRDSLSKPASSLTELNMNTLAVVRDYIGLNCSISVFSEMNIDIQGVEHPGQWALRICDELKADTYVNPIGGKDIFRLDEFSAKGIDIEFINNKLSEYSQGNKQFIEGLSIIDVLMFNNARDTHALVANYHVK